MSESTPMSTPEARAREMLDRMGIEGALDMSAGEVGELAELIAELDEARLVLARLDGLAEILAYEAALFSSPPRVGDVNPPGEVEYVGYRRTPMPCLGGFNMTVIAFPPPEQDAPVFASHVVALDGAGRVVGVRSLDESHLVREDHDTGANDAQRTAP